MDRRPVVAGNWKMHGSRAENTRLLDALLETLATPAGANPLAPEVVVCERGVDRWVMQSLARQTGIACNLDTPPPAAPDTIDRLRRGADTLSTRGAALKKLADAADPLFKSLDDGQKRRFGMLLRVSDRGGPGAGPGGGPGPRRWHRGPDGDR